MVDIRVGGKDYGSGIKELDFADMDGELDESGTRLTASSSSGTLSAVTESTTSRTLGLTDAGKVVECTNASSTTVTVPPNSSVAFPTGSIVNVYAAGAAGVTIAQGAGVTVRNLASLAQYKECSLRKRGTDEWVQVG